MLRKTSPRAWRACVLGAAAAAGALAFFSSAPAGAVAGDTVPNGTYTFTTKLDIGGGQRSCTGALVDPYWVLAASSCFADDPAQPLALAAGAPKLKTVATVGRTDLNSTSGFLTEVTELVPRADRDLVLAKLAKPAQGIPTVGIGGAPVVGETLTATGYGRTKDEWAPYALHSGSFTVQSTTDTTIAVTGKTAGKDTICKGDAGGPALRAVSGGGVELAAVNSRSWQGGCFGTTETRTGAVETRVDDLAGWLFDTRLHTASVKNSLSGLCAYVPWQTPEWGAPVLQVGCDRQYADQTWNLQKTATGNYQIRNLNSDKCMLVSWRTPDNGGPVVQADCDAQFPDQVWKLEKVDTGYQIRNTYSNKCLVAWSGDTAPGSKLTQYDCIPQYADQVWTL
ncbi:trypsin-like serine protease [Kitasatospora sp. NPDC047058]|uniref:trypsin-like serine protease n=1 Tax=Kitasatospora sp. NPDC047058 TaxID=3155620 RepID=UPI003407DC05